MRRQRSKLATILFDDQTKIAKIHGDHPGESQKLLVEFLNKEKIEDIRAVFLIYPCDPTLVDFIIGKELDEFIRQDSFPKKQFVDLLPTPKRVKGGLLVYCRESQRFLLQIRGNRREHPWLAGLWGATTESGESPALAASRGAHEEGGFRVDQSKLIPLWVDENQTSIYHNYLYVIQKEFDPELNLNKVLDYIWVGFDGLGRIDLHPGARKLFRNDVLLGQMREEFMTPKTQNPRPDYRGIVDDIMK